MLGTHCPDLWKCGPARYVFDNQIHDFATADAATLLEGCPHLDALFSSRFILMSGKVWQRQFSRASSVTLETHSWNSCCLLKPLEMLLKQVAVSWNSWNVLETLEMLETFETPGVQSLSAKCPLIWFWILSTGQCILALCTALHACRFASCGLGSVWHKDPHGQTWPPKCKMLA